MSKPKFEILFHARPSTVRLMDANVRADAASDTRSVSSPEPQVDTHSQALTAQLNSLENLLQEIGRAVADLQHERRHALSEMQEATVELATIAASWIVGAAIDAGVFAVDDLVSNMLARLNDERPVQIFLHPDDATLLTSLKETSETAAFASADVTFVPDSGLTRGMVRGESARQILITNPQDRLADIRQTWMENLSEAQTERRADESTGRELRRFPDRRHTA